MASGQGAFFQLLGKVNESGALVVSLQAVGTPGPASALANKVVAVDASNRVIVAFV